MKHSQNERLQKSEILAKEVLKAVEKCRSESMTEDEKKYHLENIEALARDCCADCGAYDPKEDQGVLG